MRGLPQSVVGDRVDEQEEQFECPECGGLFGAGTTSCPGCGMAFEWDEDETEEALDELIEQVEETKEVEAESEYDPSPEPDVVEAPVSNDVTEPQYDPSSEPDVVEAEAPVEAPAEVPLEEAPMVLEKPVAKTKALSMLGIAFAVLTVVSVIGLMVVLNYDTWINGDAENNIGDTQMTYVYLAVVAVIVCIMITVFDFMRNRKAV